jgi:hypothetical protein
MACHRVSGTSVSTVVGMAADHAHEQSKQEESAGGRKHALVGRTPAKMCAPPSGLSTSVTSSRRSYRASLSEPSSYSRIHMPFGRTIR